MKRKRVVVTGMGVASCFGNDVETFYQSLLAGTSGVKEITRFPCDDFSTRFAATIDDFDPGEYIDKKLYRRVDPFISYAFVAGKKALEMGQLLDVPKDSLNLSRCGVIIGSGMGGLQLFYDSSVTLHDNGARRVSPFFIPFVITNMASGLLAMQTGFMGPNYSISTACASANNSIIAAANHIRAGDADVMLAGGTEAGINKIGLGGFCACKALSKRNDAPEKASRPWDRGRDGFVMGEGAGVILLESLEHAQKRGAPILAEYLGGGVSCDAYHFTEPRSDGEGVAKCIQNTLKSGEIDVQRVNYINCHATSTPAGDMAEIYAMHRVIPEPEQVWINGTKSMIGHGLGAAGGLEAVVVVKAIVDGMIHPTVNLEDPEEGIRFKTSIKAEDLEIDVALSNSFGFGGHNATLAFGKFRK